MGCLPRLTFFVCLVAIVALGSGGSSGCSATSTGGTTTGDDSGGSGSTLSLTSDDMPSGSEIPENPFALSNALGCTGSAGSNTSPQLGWSNVPSTALSLAISMVDLDCTTDCSDDGNPFIHWIVYNIATTVAELARGSSENLPGSAENGGNDFNDPASIPNYGGPCPPVGVAHTYQFEIWALDTANLMDDTTITFTDADSVYNALSDHAVTGGTASFTREFTGP